ncbi:hypothetical protein PP175_25845 (plasmid) [Aneurinibacillus sp. Ricciae_BoGa-3]|uniref:hypothetical protein n=1 Tax=Aneurinibacillus sp. Ricciae_BoGa-3 TaxID=3022697 RepID=UPI0023409B37|nr:hypothetical protein [Aneurinibacillus sp. Ricciae_BoGa-3]WCK57492.1 hypothetical protein PP175_25845 [Aneurinibacillus sp. Ricciae_BoGa-3]
MDNKLQILKNDIAFQQENYDSGRQSVKEELERLLKDFDVSSIEGIAINLTEILRKAQEVAVKEIGLNKTKGIVKFIES